MNNDYDKKCDPLHCVTNAKKKKKIQLAIDEFHWGQV